MTETNRDAFKEIRRICKIKNSKNEDFMKEYNVYLKGHRKEQLKKPKEKGLICKV